MIMKIKDNKKIIIILTSIILGFFVLNGPKFLSAAFSYMMHYFDNVIFKEEVKKITFDSENYTNGTPGDYTVDKSADWTGRNEATIEFKISTNLMSDNEDKDVIFVLDTSGSMIGEKYERLSKDAIELISRLLTNPKNTVSLISFDSDVQILAEYSKDKETLIDHINNFEILGATDYYLALKAVDEVLDSYVVQEDRDCIIVFLTDGFPTQSNTNQLAQFEILNSKYPFTKIYGVQYEMGIDITEELKEVSHEQYSIEINTLKNILFDIALEPYRYDDFELTDYIDNEYFYVESLNDITTDMGTATLTEEDGKQKVVWNVNGAQFYSGAEASLKIKVKLKEKYHDLGGYYPTNTEAEVDASIVGNDKDSETTNTPVLKHGYSVLYDMNTPEGCELENIEDGTYYAYEKVEMNSTKPACDGYEFRGWKPTSKIEFINSDYYLMPTRDLTFRATWAKMEITKNMQGTVYEVITLYEAIKKQSVMDNVASKYVTDDKGINFNKPSSDTNGKGVYTIASTADDEFPVYYYRGNVDNNVIFANYCWKIVRTTETGGIKLIYNGTPSSDGKCNNTGAATEIKKVSYTNVKNATSMSYVGYMYNTVMASSNKGSYTSQNAANLYGNSFTYDESTNMYTLVDTKTFGELNAAADDFSSHHYTCYDTVGTCSTLKFAFNIVTSSGYMYFIDLKNGKDIDDMLDSYILGNNSNINTKNSLVKTEVDTWYGNNMTGYNQYIENAIYCNDRTLEDLQNFDPNGTLSIKNASLTFAAMTRIAEGKPTLECSLSDSFTLSVANGGTSGYGNNALKYPVGLLSADEITYAGANMNDANYDYYLYTGEMYWPMTAYRWNYNNRASVFIAYGSYPTSSGDFTGTINGGYAYTSTGGYGVRPVITLKNNVSYGKGVGSTDNPYVLLTN